MRAQPASLIQNNSNLVSFEHLFVKNQSDRSINPRVHVSESTERNIFTSRPRTPNVQPLNNLEGIPVRSSNGMDQLPSTRGHSRLSRLPGWNFPRRLFRRHHRSFRRRKASQGTIKKKEKEWYKKKRKKNIIDDKKKIIREIGYKNKQRKIKFPGIVDRRRYSRARMDLSSLGHLRYQSLGWK